MNLGDLGEIDGGQRSHRMLRHGDAALRGRTQFYQSGPLGLGVDPAVDNRFLTAGKGLGEVEVSFENDFPEKPAATMDARSHGADGGSLGVGDFAIAKLLQVAHDDGRSIDFGKFFEGVGQVSSELFDDHFFVGGAGWIENRQLLDFAIGWADHGVERFSLADGVFAASGVEVGALHDAQQPVEEWAPGDVAVVSSPSFDKGVLDEVFGIDRVACELKSHGVGSAPGFGDFPFEFSEFGWTSIGGFVGNPGSGHLFLPRVDC